MTGHKFTIDRVVFEPPVSLKNNSFIEVQDNSIITLSHTRSYMGVPTSVESVIVKVKEGAPYMRITTPSGSYLEGEFEIVECSQKINVKQLPRVYEGKRLFERRIIK